MKIDFKQFLDQKFISENIKIRDISTDLEDDKVISKPGEEVQEVLIDSVTVDYKELKDLLTSISSNNSLDEQTNAKIAEYVTKLDFLRTNDTLKTQLESIQMRLAEGVSQLDEANASATKKATGRFSSFMNGMYGSVLAFEKNTGMDQYYAEAFKKQAVFVPIMNVITNFLRNILESNDRVKLLAMLKNGQLVNPIVIAKYAYTVPAKVKLDSGEKTMLVPFTKEFVDSTNSVQLPDYAYKIRPFLKENYFSFDNIDGIKLRQPVNSPFIKGFLEMLLTKQEAQQTIQQAQEPQEEPQNQTAQNAEQGQTVGEQDVSIRDYNGLTIYENIINFLNQFNAPESNEVSESVTNGSNYIIDKGIQLAEEAKKFDEELSGLVKMRSELYDLTNLANRRLDDYVLTSDMKKQMKNIIELENDLHLRLKSYSVEVESYIKGLP